MTENHPSPTPIECVGECVVSVSEDPSRADASRVCRPSPSPTGDDTLSEPARVCRSSESTHSPQTPTCDQRDGHWICCLPANHGGRGHYFVRAAA